MKKPSVFGKYLLLERLNVGGMAEVFIAKAFGVEGFERILAIKKILPTMAEDAEFISMFIDEARISVQLSHANVVQIHELGRYDDAYFIAMEYVAGKDLRALLEWYRGRGEIMPTAQAAFIATKICEGLDYAHRKKDARGQDLHIIHRDVSPQNILVSYEGAVKLIDFGIAKAANRSQKTQAGILKGKFGYMSPEQVRGLPIDRRSDVFAVGVILYELLTGEKLFVGESDFSTLEMVRDANVPALHQFNPRIPPALEKVVLKALAREPGDRYQWASDFQEDLMRFLLSGDTIYSPKHLGSLMQDAFAEEILREEERMERFASIERPEEIEISGVTTGVVRSRGRGSLTSTPAVTVLSGVGRGAAGSAEPTTDLEDELGESTTCGDRTQIVDAAVGTTETPQADVLTKITGVAELTGAHLRGPATTHPTADSGAVDVPSEEAPIPARSSLALEAETRGERGQVIIGEPNGYVGATVIGPVPSAPPASDEIPVSPSQETRLAPLPNDKVPLDADEALPTDTHAVPALGDDDGETTHSRGTDPQQRRGGPGVSLLKRHALFAGVGVLVLLGLVAGLVLGGDASGSLVVVVTPEFAQLTVGEMPVKNRFEVQIPEGEHELRATAPGYRPHSQRLTVSSGKKLAIVVTLQPEFHSGQEADAGSEPGSAQPEGSPEAPLGEPTAPKGETPSKVATPSVDQSATNEPRPKPDKPTERLAEASPSEGQDSGRVNKPPLPARTNPRPAAKGQLACATRPAGAEVWVDGKSTSRQTPIPLSNPLVLPAGTHRITFKLNGKESGPHPVEIKGDETSKLTGIVLE